MPGHTQDVQVAVTDLEREQDVEPPQCHRAVDVEEVDRQHAGGLRAQELPPAGVGVPDWRRWDPVALEDPTDRRGADPMAQFEQLTLDPPVPPARISRVTRSTRATRMWLISGRPGRLRQVHLLRTR